MADPTPSDVETGGTSGRSTRAASPDEPTGGEGQDGLDGPRASGSVAPDAAASSDELHRSLVEGARELIGAFDAEGTIVAINPASRAVLGLAPEELIGRNVVEVVHPDDVERASLALDLSRTFGAPRGASGFRVRHADGHWVPLDVAAGTAVHEGRVLFSIYARTAEDYVATDETLVRLLRGAPLVEALTPVCDVFAWRVNGSRIAISWLGEDGRRAQVSTGLPSALTGAEAGPGTPWGRVRRSGTGDDAIGLDDLDPAVRAAAAELGLDRAWIEPVVVGATEPALVTVWAAEGERPPRNHAYGMQVAVNLVEVILRWEGQQRRLDHAAFHDSLTGLANRPAFFRALEQATAGGALLYGDLDGFKPVNDRFGHRAGDDVLREVAGRLAAAVGPDDLVARLGGDEFAVLCPGRDRADAEDLAANLEAVMAAPFVVAGEQLVVGMSIGIAHRSDPLDEDLLDVADRALYEVKAARPTTGGRASPLT